ncbi:uncharacterized protein LOC114456200 isoform X2 [Gouania willdenowi]|uniref:uncharacterized protein LOC114456200 isoform X2 n=1 Tax=Gouania willdenowi TaxID=441366 RepID=UPI00105521C5|nr:uncharacterized protein LOC114456200 isoform X2 [Gouania willdenowi]
MVRQNRARTAMVPPTSLIRPPADTRRKLHEPLVDGTLPPSETSSALHTHEPTHTGPSVVVPPLTRGPDPHTTETPHTGPSAIVPPPTREPDPHTPETPHKTRSGYKQLELLESVDKDRTSISGTVASVLPFAQARKRPFIMASPSTARTHCHSVSAPILQFFSALSIFAQSRGMKSAGNKDDTNNDGEEE